MKARYLLSILAAIACPAALHAQTPGPAAPPPPPDHREAHPPGEQGPGPSNAHPGESHPGFGHHHFGNPQANAPHTDGTATDPRERFVHLREAIHHLRAAGMNEEAERLENQARKFREEFAQHHREGPQGNHGPGMQGAPGPGNFSANQGPQGIYDVRAQLEHVMREVQELRREVQAMHGKGHHKHHHRGRHHDDFGANPSSHGDSFSGGHHPDGMNQNQGPRQGHGPAPQAAGPQAEHPVFPRPEWRDHGGANNNHHGDNAGHPHGPPHDGVKPPTPPQGNPPANGPVNEESLPESDAAPVAQQ